RLRPGRAVGGAGGGHGVGIEALERLPQIDAPRRCAQDAGELRGGGGRVLGQNRLERAEHVRVDVIPAPAVLVLEGVRRGEDALLGGGEDGGQRCEAGGGDVEHRIGDRR